MTVSATPSRRMQALGGYPFAELRELAQALAQKGIRPIDFGVGDPLDPTPDFVRASLSPAADRHATAGYPSYIGSASYRAACAEWMHRRFGVLLDPAREICSTIGSKEAVFHFAEAFVDPGDYVLVPSPGYPPMKTGTLFAEGVPYFVPLRAENGYLIDFDGIPPDVVRRAKVLWLNYPNSPTGAVAPLAYYERLVAWAHAHDILLAADEGCYIDLYYGAPPASILQVAREGVLTFYSLSKRNNMTGYRVGFVAGDERLVTTFKNLKTHIDSGTPNFIQDAAGLALRDETHVAAMRARYRRKRDVLLAALADVGLPVRAPEATFFVWQQTPPGLSAVAFAKRLLAEDLAIVVTPGTWISDPCADGQNPGEGYVRFALVPTLEQVEEAAARIRRHLRV